MCYKGCWIIVVAASLLFMMSHVVMRVTDTVIKERELECLYPLESGNRDAPEGLVSRLLQRLSTS